MASDPDSTSYFRPSADAPVPSELGGLNPDELFARGMQSVRMTGGGGLNSWDPPTIEEATRLFPNFEILEQIGRGGMGVVYKARQTALDRLVAIKLLPLEVSVDKDFADRFVREARTMARMNHPNIVSVYDFGKTSEGHLYFVMEFVEGTTLHSVIRGPGLKPEQTLEIIVGVCEALHYAHSEGVVHRDIKPANVLVDVKGRVKVTDFGLARLNNPSAEQWGYTMTGTVLGTPDYMAPEQKRGMHVDHRADIYSLGVMLYEMLCGEVPQGIFDPPSQRVSVDSRIDQVVIRAMQQEPDRRYQNTDDMRTDVQTIRTRVDTSAVAPTPRAEASSSPSRTEPVAETRGKTPVFVGLGALAVGALGAIVWMNNQQGQIREDFRPEPTPAVAPLVSAATPTGEGEPRPATEEQPVKPETPPTVAAANPPAPAAPTEPAPPVSQPPAPQPTVAATELPPAVPSAPAVAANPGVVVPPPQQPVEMQTPQVNPPPVTTNIAPPVAPQAAPVIQWRVLASQGDALLRQRAQQAAAEMYVRAIDSAENAEPPVDPYDLALLYRKLGALEVVVASPIEARRTYERGRQILVQARAKGRPSDEHVKLMEEFDSALRRLPRDE